MNPDLFTDGGADFRLDAFHKAHAYPAESVGGPDRGGNFQRGLFDLAPAQVRGGVDVFQCVRRFSCFQYLFFGSVADSFNDTTILSGALLLKCKFSRRTIENIGRNHCHHRHLTQPCADFARGDPTDF